jgi:hypothetical protein
MLSEVVEMVVGKLVDMLGKVLVLLQKNQRNPLLKQNQQLHQRLHRLALVIKFPFLDTDVGHGVILVSST